MRGIVVVQCAPILQFLPARRSKRGMCYGNVADWLAGCLSHAGIVSKRINLS